MNHPTRRTLIIGAGEAGTLLGQQILQTKKSKYNIIGYIDDDPKKQNIKVNKVPVLGKISEIPEVINDYRISDVIIAMPSVEQSVLLKFVNQCKKTSVRIKLLPREKDLLDSKIIADQIYDINVKDLLGREMIEPTNRLKNYLKNKSILITGAGGSIGSELVSQVATFQPRLLILIGHGENSIYNIELNMANNFPHIKTHFIIADIQDKQYIEKIFQQHQPEIVFHAAAHKHVPLMERNEGAAVRNNIIGTNILAEAAVRFKTERFIFISTDKAVDPVNVMGMTKRVAEMVIQKFSENKLTKFSIVRFGNVLESRGSVIPIFKKQIKAGGPVTITHPDMVRYFMTIPEAVLLVLEAGSLSKGGEIFVLDMGEPVKILDLAKNLIRLSGYEPDSDIQIKFTGVRPGEKLIESLFYDSEKIVSTDHPYIVVAKPRSINGTHFKENLKELKKSIYSPVKLRSILTRIIQNGVTKQ
ncbi:nucleoside-diphosphate sugar epimerase/dehydratase [Alteribacillus sp. YIM 98480]|uniref:polysaccharide biosynthesis protein n=1 Tax=Alteribacillus sp. YIM 98480 TaxID=2606599 RepID=UPI00131BBE8F|nr:nucleoside-diphosphate sugar epimerase/dehydratase [Alteribacillus sp. YIM 98480]